VDALGPIPSIAPVLREASLLVLPSWQEGFGIVAAEALAAGVPVLTTPCGGPEHLVRASGGGVVLDGFGADELAAAATELLTDAGTLSRMRASGREYVVREHSPARFRSLLADLIDLP
jgi:glycosyltransferase involved in cell wall biosynthesis